MSEYPTPEYLSPEEAYNRCNDQLERARIMLNTYADGDNTLQLVNAIRRVSWGVSQLNEHLKALDKRITSLERDVEELAGLTGDNFGDGLPF